MGISSLERMVFCIIHRIGFFLRFRQFVNLAYVSIRDRLLFLGGIMKQFVSFLLIFSLGCKGFQGAFLDGEKEALFQPNAKVKIPSDNGNAVATVIDINGDGVADGLDFNGDGVPEVLYIIIVINEVAGLDINGDNVADYFIRAFYDGVVISADKDGTQAVTLIMSGNLPAGFDTNGDGTADDPRLSHVYQDKTPPSSNADNAGGAFSSAQTVTITCSDNVACLGIYYTVDGSPVNTSSGKLVLGQSVQITISASSVLRWKARDTAGNMENTDHRLDFIIPKPNPATGTLDTSFATSGIFRYGGDGNLREAQSAAWDSQGRLLIVGYENISDYAMILLRLNQDGSPDTAFGTSGIVKYDRGSGADEYGRSVTTDSQNRILVAGYWYNGLNADIAIWRYLENGSPDTSFDSDGLVVNNSAALGGGNDDAYAIAIDKDGKILVAGSSEDPSLKTKAVVLRFNADGTLDTSFDSDGIVVASCTHNCEAYSMALDNSGNIFISGYADDNSSVKDIAVWKFKPDGSVDTSFGTSGKVIIDGGASNHDEGYTVQVDSAGYIYVAGYAENNSVNRDSVLIKLDANGNLVSSFASSGKYGQDNVAGGSGHDIAYHFILDYDNNILMTGYSQDGSNKYEMILWRLTSSGSLDTSFNASTGYLRYDNTNGGYDYYGYAVLLGKDGKIYVAGSAGNNSSGTDLAVWRYQ